ncbi:MAG: hypothetical protein D3924_01480 [Candidatus Electrothrix sp. AR4]|nr:hypothetical protein [Candidatus Electrothrix sp. AR4]
MMQKLLILSKAEAGRFLISPNPVIMIGMIEDVEIIAPHLRIDQKIKPSLTVQTDIFCPFL